MNNLDEKQSPEEDPLLRALRELVPVVVDDGAATRLQREARSAFVRAHRGDDATWHGRLLGGGVGRAFVPIALAGVVCIYLTWAIGAATALVN